MLKLPLEIENEIFNYLDLKCRICYIKICNQSEYENCIILKKFIFCSKKCYEFI